MEEIRLAFEKSCVSPKGGPEPRIFIALNLFDGSIFLFVNTFRTMKNLICVLLSFLFFCLKPGAQNLVAGKNEPGAFALVGASETATIVVDGSDDSLVQVATRLFGKDIEMIAGKSPAVSTSLPASKNIVLIGSMGKSRFIQQLANEKKLNTSSLEKKWEGYQIQVVKTPFKGINQALVIAGSDRRGTAYGVFELSKQLGVSPWWWWADVPVKKKKVLFIKANASFSDA
jgi:hypothetical protein